MDALSSKINNLGYDLLDLDSIVYLSLDPGQTVNCTDGSCDGGCFNGCTSCKPCCNTGGK
jgi:hypothetical protein